MCTLALSAGSIGVYKLFSYIYTRAGVFFYSVICCRKLARAYREPVCEYRCIFFLTMLVLTSWLGKIIIFTRERRCSDLCTRGACR